MTIKAILFDFDDTLGNREEYTHRTYSKRIDEILPDADPWYREQIIQQCLIYDQHGEVRKDYIRGKILEVYGIDLGEAFPAYWADHQWRNAVLYDEAIPVLTELKKRGYKTGVITNGNSFNQHRKVEATGLVQYLDVLVVSGDIDLPKPDPAIFRYGADMLGLKCEECAYVGDMFRNDICGAYGAGMMPVWIWPHNPDRYADVPVTKIRTLSDLLDLFPGVEESGEQG